MYKKIWIFIYFTIAAMNNVFPDNPYPIEGIDYNNFDFSYDYKAYDLAFSKRSLTILGWSRTGNLFYCKFTNGDKSYYIKNLVDDEIIWSCWDIRDITISEIITRFSIEPNVGSIGEFPFQWNNYLYKCYDANVGQRGAPPYYTLLMDIYIKRNENKEKKLNMIEIMPLSKNLEYWYVKSPFENRIGVIVVSSYWGIRNEIKIYHSDIIGCQLDDGFNEKE